MENTAYIDNHPITADYFNLATKYSFESAQYYDEGQHERASEIELIAMGYVQLGIEYQGEATIKHPLNYEK